MSNESRSCALFFISHCLFFISSGFLASLGMTNEMENKTATSSALICQHNPNASIRICNLRLDFF